MDQPDRGIFKNKEFSFNFLLKHCKGSSLQWEVHEMGLASMHSKPDKTIGKET